MGDADPAIHTTILVVKHFLQWWASPAGIQMHNRLGRAWPKILERLAAAKQPWRLAVGPCSVLIPTMERWVWQIMEPDLWVSPLGDSYRPEATWSLKPFLGIISLAWGFREVA